MIDALLFIGFIGFGVVGLTLLIIGLTGKEWFVSVIGVLLCVASLLCIKLETYACEKLDEQPWDRPAPYVTHKIVALQDGNEINGSFRSRKYGVSGYINEEFMYIYGYQTLGGGMKIQKVSEKNATVYFDDEVTPNAKWYKETKEFWWMESTRYTCDIFIPTDSLQAELIIDLQ